MERRGRIFPIRAVILLREGKWERNSPIHSQKVPIGNLELEIFLTARYSDNRIHRLALCLPLLFPCRCDVL